VAVEAPVSVQEERAGRIVLGVEGASDGNLFVERDSLAGVAALEVGAYLFSGKLQRTPATGYGCTYLRR
jgi:hypothetical protein